ncbi:AEC family transporter [Rhodovarius crocodyli]|uniref:AEC family transporter n=1 Tax=Rhodovarius crocodyli TaxID=1979269 RepID=A0A437MDH9_9PROT|nr:AEC family transporter [Rhodovarius crocodyli]RVT95646.1 AEC family transporter [Rhodovarius crocodyli]
MFAAYLDAFVPAFGLLVLGAFLKRRLLPDDTIWAGMERLIFWVLLPSLLVGAISEVKMGEVPILGMLAAIWIGLGLGTVLSVMIARAWRQDHPAMTSVLQGGIRFNNLIGFAIAGAIMGAPGVTLGAVATGLIVPFVQLMTTVAFALGRPGRLKPLLLLRQIFLNPLIVACILGFVIAGLGGLPPGVKPLVRSLGQATIALGLLAVGAALSLGALRDRLSLQLVTTTLKLLVVPAITYALCLALGLDPLATATAVLFMALPTAATSYVMARAMGGDAPLMAAITTIEHMLAVVTLPLWITLLR